MIEPRLEPQSSRRTQRIGFRVVAYVFFFVTFVTFVVPVHVQDAGVTFQRLLRTADEPQNWLTYSGGVLSQRYSPLTEITPANVKNLELKWVYQVQSLEKFEATPLVVDGVMYTVQAPNDVVALDAATGRIFWTYSYAPSPQ